MATQLLIAQSPNLRFIDLNKNSDMKPIVLATTQIHRQNVEQKYISEMIPFPKAST